MNACVELGKVIDLEDHEMPKGRWQVTLGSLMTLVAVCGYEVLHYRRLVEQKAEMKLAVSIADNIYLYGFGILVFWGVSWVVSSRLRAARAVVTQSGHQASGNGGTNA